MTPEDRSPGAWAPDMPALKATLEPGLTRHYGRPRSILAFESRISEYSTSFTIDEIDVTLDGGERLSLVRKDLSWQSLRGDAKEVRPRFLYDPQREIRMYEHVLAHLDAGTPTCYAAVTDAATDQHWLLLERVPSAKLCHVGAFDAWEESARWLARFHAGDASAMAEGRVPTLQYADAFARLWIDRARAFLEQARAVSAQQRRDFQRIVDGYDRVIFHLLNLTPTLIHGEFYPSNILVQEVPGRMRICPIDWEMVMVGPGLIDLAALSSGNWTTDRQAAMTRAYRESLATCGAPVMPLDEMRRSLDYCRLHLAVQWLGWASDWQAPADQAHDWLAQAMQLAETLEL